MWRWHKKLSHWHWTLLMLIAMMLAYSFPYIFQQRPFGIHLWRQTDGLSFARHYYDNGLNFFDIRIFQLVFQDLSSAKTAGEFTGIYYIVAVLWKLFGVHEWIFRAVTLTIFILGMRSALHVVATLTGSKLWSSFIILLLFTSPAVVFYSCSFLPDVHAIAFCFMACHVFLNYHKTGSVKKLYLAMLLFAIGGLLKITALIPLIVLGLIFLFETAGGDLRIGKKIFAYRLHAVAGFLLVVLINFSWLAWVRHYNFSYGGWFTYQAVFPPWNLEPEYNKNVAKWFRFFLVNQAFGRSALLLILACGLMSLLAWRRINRFAKIVLSAVTTGSGMYALLFWKWDVHDYYMLVLSYWVITVLTVVVWLMRTRVPNLLQALELRVFAFLFLAFNTWYCADNMQLRYRPRAEKLYLLSPSQAEVNHFKYLDEQYRKKFSAFDNIEPWLVTIGCNENDLVISLPDESFNASLYLMHRRGWTSYLDDAFTAEGIIRRIERGAKFLLVNDEQALLKKNFPGEFMRHKISQYKNVSVYDLRSVRPVVDEPLQQ